MDIQFLNANHGDSILISFENKNILIDGGTGSTYQFKNKKGKQEAGGLKIAIEALRDKGQKLDLLILTHVDDDHIGGLLKWFEKDQGAKNMVSKVWFNSSKLIFSHFNKPQIADNFIELKDNLSLDTSIKQGVKFEDYIEKNKIWDKQLIQAGKVYDQLGLKFTLLSPNEQTLQALLFKWEQETKNTDTAISNDYQLGLNQHLADDVFEEDESVHNGSSIAFILSYDTKNMVFLGDAHPQVIIDSLKALGYSTANPLHAEFIKVSHHGSKGNTNSELLSLINTQKYIISTNGNIHKLPHKKCLARIINHNSHAQIYFNYPNLIDDIFNEQDRADYPHFGIASTIGKFVV